MSRSKVTLTAGFAALALGGAMMASAPAQAGAGTGTWRNGAVATPYGVATPRYGYRSAGYGYGRPYYRNRSNGGAVAAGVVGGLALGALAAGAASPAYPAPRGYYGASYYDGPDCYTVRRRFVDDWGRVFVRRTRVCE